MLFLPKAALPGIVLAALSAALILGCGSAAAPTEPPPPGSRPLETTAPAVTTLEEESVAPEPAAEVTPNSSATTGVESPDEPVREEVAAKPAATVTAATDPAPTATETPVPAPLTAVEGDGEPEWAREMRDAGLRRGIWETDFSKRSVPYNEIFSGGVSRDGIPPIDNPKFLTVEEAGDWLEDLEPVVALEIDGEARAYPLQIMTWHEIVNDTVGGVPVAATFCPLCNSAIVFERRLDGVVYDFGVSGMLRNSDLIMWDRQTESWWQQLTGKAIVGELTGQWLPIVPATIVAWQDFRATYPEGQVLSRDTGYGRNYGSNPYVGYDKVGESPFLFFGKEDGRLLPTERVAALTIGDEAIAFPFSFLEAEGVVQYRAGEQELVVFFRPGARSALDGFDIASSRKVGATGIFLRDLDGQILAFELKGEDFVDKETGTTWNIFGQGVSGPLAGKQLTPVVHANHFWFAWAAFQPDTLLVREAQ